MMQITDGDIYQAWHDNQEAYQYAVESNDKGGVLTAYQNLQRLDRVSRETGFHTRMRRYKAGTAKLGKDTSGYAIATIGHTRRNTPRGFPLDDLLRNGSSLNLQGQGMDELYADKIEQYTVDPKNNPENGVFKHVWNKSGGDLELFKQFAKEVESLNAGLNAGKGPKDAGQVAGLTKTLWNAMRATGASDETEAISFVQQMTPGFTQDLANRRNKAGLAELPAASAEFEGMQKAVGVYAKLSGSSQARARWSGIRKLIQDGNILSLTPEGASDEQLVHGLTAAAQQTRILTDKLRASGVPQRELTAAYDDLAYFGALQSGSFRDDTVRAAALDEQKKQWLGPALAVLEAAASGNQAQLAAAQQSHIPPEARAGLTAARMESANVPEEKRAEATEAYNRVLENPEDVPNENKVAFENNAQRRNSLGAAGEAVKKILPKRAEVVEALVVPSTGKPAASLVDYLEDHFRDAPADALADRKDIDDVTKELFAAEFAPLTQTVSVQSRHNYRGTTPPRAPQARANYVDGKLDLPHAPSPVYSKPGGVAMHTEALGELEVKYFDVQFPLSKIFTSAELAKFADSKSLPGVGHIQKKMDRAVAADVFKLDRKGTKLAVLEGSVATYSDVAQPDKVIDLPAHIVGDPDVKIDLKALAAGGFKGEALKNEAYLQAYAWLGQEPGQSHTDSLAAERAYRLGAQERKAAQEKFQSVTGETADVFGRRPVAAAGKDGKMQKSGKVLSPLQSAARLRAFGYSDAFLKPLELVARKAQDPLDTQKRELANQQAALNLLQTRQEIEIARAESLNASTREKEKMIAKHTLMYAEVEDEDGRLLYTPQQARALALASLGLAPEG